MKEIRRILTKVRSLPSRVTVGEMRMLADEIDRLNNILERLPNQVGKIAMQESDDDPFTANIQAGLARDFVIIARDALLANEEVTEA